MIRFDNKSTPAAVSPGFTVLELLVVIAIMGLLAAIAIPSMKGTRHTNAFSAANGQLINDLSFARKRALNERTTVYVLFAPPVTNSATYPNNLSQRAYRIFAERTVGDQPGRPSARYLTDWIKLPENIVIPTHKFTQTGYSFPVTLQSGIEQRVIDPFPTRAFPYPKVTDPVHDFPYLAFNPRGSLEGLNKGVGAAVIPLFWPKAETQKATLAEVTENYDHVVVDGLTGRTRVDTPEIE